MKKFDFCLFLTATFVGAKHKTGIIKELEKRGYSCLAITSSEAGDTEIRKIGISNFRNLEEMSSTIKVNENEMGEKIAQVEKIFGIENLRVEVLNDKLVFEEKNEKKLLKKMVCYLLALKGLFDKEGIEVKYFVQGISGSINAFAFYYFGKTSGTHIYHSPSPFRDLINFSLHPWGIFEIEEEDVVVPPFGEREFISNYITKLKQEKKLALYSPLELTNPHITKGRFRLLWGLIKSRKEQNLLFFFTIKNFCLRYFRRLYVRKFYRQPKEGEKYIFFPLHLPLDSQLTQRAVPFVTQEFVVEIVSRYLPFGYKLYVKEHPAAEGWYPIKMLDYISKIPNVRILPPYLNPHELIEKAAMVCVINSTVGFESLMYQKPVITFGESFYSNKGVTLDVKDLYDLPKIIEKAKTFKPDWDRILALFNLWRKKSFPPPPEEIFSCAKEPTEESIKAFCNSFLKYLKLGLQK